LKAARAEEMRVTVSMEAKKPDYSSLARSMLQAAREFYQNPENEKAFQKWLRERESKATA